MKEPDPKGQKVLRKVYNKQFYENSVLVVVWDSEEEELEEDKGFFWG